MARNSKPTTTTKDKVAATAPATASTDSTIPPAADSANTSGRLCEKGCGRQTPNPKAPYCTPCYEQYQESQGKVRCVNNATCHAWVKEPPAGEDPACGPCKGQQKPDPEKIRESAQRFADKIADSAAVLKDRIAEVVQLFPDVDLTKVTELRTDAKKAFTAGNLPEANSLVQAAFNQLHELAAKELAEAIPAKKDEALGMVEPLRGNDQALAGLFATELNSVERYADPAEIAKILGNEDLGQRYRFLRTRYQRICEAAEEIGVKIERANAFDTPAPRLSNHERREQGDARRAQHNGWQPGHTYRAPTHDEQ